MKKLSTIAFAFVLIFSLAACGCQAQESTPATTIPTTSAPVTTAPATTATTMPASTATVPSMDPTIDTNIPDPEVDSNSTEMTEDTTESTGANEDYEGNQSNGTDTSVERSRMSR